MDEVSAAIDAATDPREEDRLRKRHADLCGWLAKINDLRCYFIGREMKAKKAA